MAVRVLFGAATICGVEASWVFSERSTGVDHESTAHAGVVWAIAVTPTSTLNTRATTKRRNTATERPNDIRMNPLE
jgi:hypothetical protein